MVSFLLYMIYTYFKSGTGCQVPPGSHREVIFMEGSKRRAKIVDILKDRSDPISGSKLAKHLGVSRQVIVQDVALLRASNYNVLATTKGYVLDPDQKSQHKRLLQVKHTTDEIEDELCTIVDQGGRVLNVVVDHDIYGEIATELIIRNRSDVYDFVKKVKENKIVPLKELTFDVHLHTVEADSEEILDRVEEALREKNYLV